MKKTSAQLVGWIFLAAVLLLWMVKATILSECMSHLLRVPVSIGIFNWHPTRLEFEEWTIRNPKGFSKKKALEIRTIEVDYSWSELTKNPLVIDRIELDQVLVRVEFFSSSSSRNNWTHILGKIPRKTKGKNIQINKLIVKDLKVEIQGSGVPAEVRSVQNVELANIQSQQGFPTEELIQQIFGQAGAGEFIEGILPLGPDSFLQRIFHL